MAKKAEPKFKINPSLLGMMVNGEYCTFDEKRLDKVTFPKSFDGILTIPAEVTQIGKFVCAGKQEITEVIFPDTLRFFSSCAFEKCTNLVRFNFPSSLILPIGSDCFSGCTKLSSITVSSDQVEKAKKPLPEELHKFIEIK